MAVLILLVALASLFFSGFILGDLGHDDEWRWPSTERED